MKPEEIDFLIELLRRRAGYALDREKTYLMESRLAPVARREGFGSIRELLGTTRQRKDERLAWAIVEAVVCGETSFFRDAATFKRIRQEMLPTLAAARMDQPVRIWSAGCATGQEPYSVAMMIDEDRAALGEARFEIVAADLSQRALEKGHAGLYTQFEVQLGLPIRSLVRHFERKDDMWQMSPRLRAAINWRRMNLNADLCTIGRFDLVLCRNVIGHMDPLAADRLLDQLAGMVAANGYLVLGAGEAAVRLNDSFATMSDGLMVRRPSARVAA